MTPTLILSVLKKQLEDKNWRLGKNELLFNNKEEMFFIELIFAYGDYYSLKQSKQVGKEMQINDNQKKVQNLMVEGMGEALGIAIRGIMTNWAEWIIIHHIFLTNFLC